jgi:hypothetical protein
MNELDLKLGVILTDSEADEIKIENKKILSWTWKQKNKRKSQIGIKKRRKNW